MFTFLLSLATVDVGERALDQDWRRKGTKCHPVRVTLVPTGKAKDPVATIPSMKFKNTKQEEDPKARGVLRDDSRKEKGNCRTIPGSGSCQRRETGIKPMQRNSHS